MKVAVTGASGHIGVNLVHRLLSDGADVRVLVHRHAAPLAGLDVEVAHGSVLDRDSLTRAFTGTDVVFHLAGIISISGDPTGSVRSVNVLGAENAARAALEAGVRRMVHCSSIHAFDMQTPGPIDESSPRVGGDPRRHTAYERSKAEGERRVQAVVRRGLDAVVVHPTSVIGPRDFEPSRMGRVFIRLRNRRLPGLVIGGFDFVDVRDVALGMIAAARRGRRGESYLLSGHRLDIGEVAEVAGAVTGVSPPRIRVPIGLARLGLPVARLSGVLRRSEPLFTGESLAALKDAPAVSRAKAASELGYEVRPIHRSVRDLYLWFAERGLIEPSGSLMDDGPAWDEQ